MSVFRKLLLALAVAALLVAACSPTDGASDGEPSAESPTNSPATSSTVATTTTAPFVGAFPDVAVEFRELDSSENPQPHRTVAEVVAEATSDAPAQITLGTNLAFRPARLEVEGPAPVEFVNESDRDIELTFDWDGLDPLALASGQSATVDLSGDAPNAIRFSTIVGSARLGGAIFTASEPDETGSTEAPGELIPPSAEVAIDLSGSIQLDLPAVGTWHVVAGHRSITLTPESPVLPLGSTGWLLASGEAPLEETLRLDASDGFDRPAADAAVASFTAPEACVEANSRPASGRSWTCGDFELVIHSIQLGEAWAVVSIARESGSTQFGAALDSVESADPGTFAAPTDVHPALFQGRPKATGPDALGPEVIDIASGSFGSPATLYSLIVGASPEIEIRNFIDEPVSLRANGLPFVQLPPRAAATFSVDDFESTRIGLSFGEDPITRIDLPLDATLRHPLPAIPMTASGLAPVLSTTSESLEEVHPFFDVLATDELYPESWVRVDESDVWFWNQPGWVVYARDLDESDPAVLARGFRSGAIAPLIHATNVHVRSLPTEERGDDEAGLVRWVVPGRPTISMFYSGDLVFRAGVSSRLIVFLQSSPDDHEALLNQLVNPYLRSFSVIEAGE